MYTIFFTFFANSQKMDLISSELLNQFQFVKHFVHSLLFINIFACFIQIFNANKIYDVGNWNYTNMGSYLYVSFLKTNLTTHSTRNFKVFLYEKTFAWYSNSSFIHRLYLHFATKNHDQDQINLVCHCRSFFVCCFFFSRRRKQFSYMYTSVMNERLWTNK